MTTILDVDGYKMGSVSKDGRVLSKTNTPIGRVDISGEILNYAGTRVGTFKPDGNVFKAGVYVGDVKTDGKVYDKDNDYVGRIKGAHTISAGAALLLLII